MQVQISYSQATNYDIVFHTEAAAKEFAAQLSTTEGIFDAVHVATRVKYFSLDSSLGFQLAHTFEDNWVQRQLDAKNQALAEAAQASEKTETVPVEEPAETVPVDEKAETVPVEEPAETVPVDEKAETADAEKTA